MKPYIYLKFIIKHMSPPARGRGLKQYKSEPYRIMSESPPARGRGLKLWIVLCCSIRNLVAPRAGAWIETTLT